MLFIRLSVLCHTASLIMLALQSTIQQVVNSRTIVLQQLLSMGDLLMRKVFHPLVISNSSIPYLKNVRRILGFFCDFFLIPAPESRVIES